MIIKEGIIENPLVKSKRMLKPSDIAHKDFMLIQKSEWKEFHRIILGRWKTDDYLTKKEIEWWCNENVYGRWFHSEANEVYYFEDENSAIFFKLKWFSVIATEGN